MISGTVRLEQKEIASDADLRDGLHVSELVGAGLGFEFDGPELGTGRDHPSIFQLFANGTCSICSSNNTGGINPFTGVEVNVGIGDEYISKLARDGAIMPRSEPDCHIRTYRRC